MIKGRNCCAMLCVLNALEVVMGWNLPFLCHCSIVLRRHTQIRVDPVWGWHCPSIHPSLPSLNHYYHWSSVDCAFKCCPFVSAGTHLERLTGWQMRSLTRDVLWRGAKIIWQMFFTIRIQHLIGVGLAQRVMFKLSAFCEFWPDTRQNNQTSFDQFAHSGQWTAPSQTSWHQMYGLKMAIKCHGWFWSSDQ